MALTLPEALKRTQNPMMAGIAREIITTDALGAVIPMSPLPGTMVKIAREGDAPTGGAFIPDSGATSEVSNGTDDVVEVPVRRIVGNMDIDNLAIAANDTHPAAQLSRKIRATWENILAKLITGGRTTGFTVSGAAASPGLAVDAVDAGPWLDSDRKGPGSLKYTNTGTFWQFRAPGDAEYGPQVACATDGTYLLKSGNPSYWIRVTLDVSDATADGECLIRFTTTTNEFDGLQELVSPARVIDPDDADGDAFSLAILDRMITNEKIRRNRAFILPSQLIEKYYAIMRALGGATPPMMQLEGYGGASVPSYRNIPLLECDNVPATETVGSTTTCASIYLASLDEMEGLSLGVFNRGGASFNIQADPRAREVLGWRVVELGERDEYDHQRTRVKWYGAPSLRSTRALVRKRGVKTA